MAKQIFTWDEVVKHDQECDPITKNEKKQMRKSVNKKPSQQQHNESKSESVALYPQHQ